MTLTNDELTCLIIIEDILKNENSSAGSPRIWEWMFNMAMIKNKNDKMGDETEPPFSLTDEGKKFHEYLIKTKTEESQ